MRGRPSVLKNVLAVILKERRVRLRDFIGQMNSVACILGEALLQRGVWEITRETLAEDESRLFVECHQPRVKRRIMELERQSPFRGLRRSLGKSRHGLMWLATKRRGTEIPVMQQRTP